MPATKRGEKDADHSSGDIRRYLRPNVECHRTSTHEDGDIDILERLFDTNSIIDALSSLIIAVDTDRVRLAHFSVAEYLTSDRLAKSEMGDFWVSVRDCKPRLLRACLRYMQTEAIQVGYFGSPPDDYAKAVCKPPLLHHAARCWVGYELGCFADQPIPTVPMIVSFLLSEPAMLLWKAGSNFWSTLQDPHRNTKWLFGRAKGYDSSDAAYFAAFYGLEKVMRVLLTAHVTETRNGFADALHISCLHGHTPLVRLLIAAGAKTSMNALAAALDAVDMGKPNADLILLLLDKISLDPQSALTAQLLRWSIRMPQRRIVEKVIETFGGGYAASEKICQYKTAPSLVSRAESYNYRGSPYYDAVLGGDAGIVALFLDCDNLNEWDSEGRTALYWAVFYGNEAIVRLLFHYGAKPDAVVLGYGWTPMYWAMKNKNETIRLLLEQAMEWDSQ